MKTLNVNSKYGNYSVIIDESFEKLAKRYLNAEDKYVIIYDKRVPKKYLDYILAKSIKPLIIKVNGGEKIKTQTRYNKLIKILTKNNISKNDILIAVGGGTITDLVGYVAATYKRGIRFISFPTTTLSMIDASVGGKNGVNVGEIKNAIGSFHPPLRVLMGLDVLDSLNKREYNDGLYEALKTGIILNEDLFNIFKNGDPRSNIKKIITMSLESKIKIVEQDEEEKGIRRILNFGHTVGHAIETEKKYHLKHGEAIANGMLVISKNEQFYGDLLDILRKMRCKLVTKIDYESIEPKLKNDKKVEKGKIEVVKVKQIGKAEFVMMSFKDLKKEIVKYVI